MEILEKITYLYQKFSNLKINKEEYVVMKVINYLNQGNIWFCEKLSVVKLEKI